MQIPQIEPFQFIAGTAFSERVQLANKINEIIDGINSIGEIPDLQAQIDTINSTLQNYQQQIGDLNTDVAGLESSVNDLITEVNGLLAHVTNEIRVDAPGYGQVRVTVVHEDESEIASNALQIPVIQDGSITLISGTTDRSFKIQYATMDGVTHTTNDFVIPEGGGTDVTVTSITIVQGDTPSDIKFTVGLSDGSDIESNSYPIPQAAITPATTSQIGGIKVGDYLAVTADGTLSVPQMANAGNASTLNVTGSASGVNVGITSIGGTATNKTIPNASATAAGVITAEEWQKLEDVPSPETIATMDDLGDVQEQITGLKLSKSGENNITLNGDSVPAVSSVSGSINESGELVITVNGVSGSGIPLPDSIPEPIATSHYDGDFTQINITIPSGTTGYTYTSNSEYDTYRAINISTYTKLLVSVGDDDDPEFIEVSPPAESSYIALGLQGKTRYTDTSGLYVLNDNSSVIAELNERLDEIVQLIRDFYDTIKDGHYYIALGFYQVGTYITNATNLGLEFDVTDNVISNPTLKTDSLKIYKTRSQSTSFPANPMMFTLSTKGFPF